MREKLAFRMTFARAAHACTKRDAQAYLEQFHQPRTTCAVAHPRTYLHYHDPIFDRLQSSYDDVNFEIDLMRGTIYHRYSGVIFLGGDAKQIVSATRQKQRT